MLLGGRGPWGIGDDGLAGTVEGNGNVAALGGIFGELPLPAPEHEPVETAAVQDDGAVQFLSGRIIQLAQHDAEIAADVDEDGADRATAVLGEDLLERGFAGEGWAGGRVVRPGGRFGGARLAGAGQAGRVGLQFLSAGGAAAEPFFEGGGAEQAAADAGADLRDIGRGEDARDEGEPEEETWVGGMLRQGVGEVAAVGDERANEAEDAADPRRHGPIGGIWVAGFGRCGGCVEHGWD